MIIGDAACGKSCLSEKFSDNIFVDLYSATIGMDFKVKTIDHNGRIIMLQIWDTSGQWRYRVIKIEYHYRKCHGFIIVFDLTRRDSFTSLSMWINEIYGCGKPFIIIGAKSDLESQREVTYDEAREFAERNNACYIEVSNINGHNVENAFRLITNEIISNPR